MEKLNMIRKKQDQELTVAQVMSSLLQNSDLKNIGETTSPFRYNLNESLMIIQGK